MKKATHFTIQRSWKILLTDMGLNPAHVLALAGLLLSFGMVSADRVRVTVSVGLIVVGTAFDVLGCVGLIRLPDVYNRLQAATKCVTLGTCSILLGAAVATGGPAAAKAALCLVFILVTSPVAAHAIARGAHCAGIRLWDGSVGDDYLVTVRISADSHMPDGFHVPDTIEYCKMAIKAGADGIHLSDGCYEAMKYFLPEEDGQVVEESGMIKKGIKEGLGEDFPVICPSVHNPDLASETVETGKADIISQGRALIADPEWPNKVKEGRAEDIVKCLRCNRGCIQRFVLGLPSRCVVNPEMGEEKYIERYNTRPVLPIKKRAWKTLNQL